MVSKGASMAIKARIGAGEWDMLICDDCTHLWHDEDVDPGWTDEPEGDATLNCPACGGSQIVREERC